VDGVLVQGFFGILGLVSWALFAFALFAFIDAAIRRNDAYRAADKNNKGFWLIILGIAAIVMKLFSIFSFLPILGLIAVIVYTVDVRPALKQVSGGGGGRWGGGGGGSSSDGPYGPYNR
jgi:O-antigen ligase